MNIHVVTSSPSFTVLEHIYETLFYMNTEGELEPLLAEEMTANDDGSFTLKLREGITFSDGAPFNAEAVKANLDWVLNTDNAATFRFLIDRVEEVVVVDEYTVDLKMLSPFAPCPPTCPTARWPWSILTCWRRAPTPWLPTPSAPAPSCWIAGSATRL
jgi:peptide/nickel transport system substrate-binding protein